MLKHHLQVLGTLLIYVLFMVEEFRKAPVENMDEVIYCVNGTYRLLEFLVSVTHAHTVYIVREHKRGGSMAQMPKHC